MNFLRWMGSPGPLWRTRKVRISAVAMAGAALVIPLTLGTSATSAGAASSAVNPNGVLKYGYDLNSEFSNDFDPGTEENDCAYTVFQNIFESVAVPGQTAISPGVAQSWTISNNASTVTLHIR